jgi:hypothetical protein
LFTLEITTPTGRDRSVARLTGVDPQRYAGKVMRVLVDGSKATVQR